MKTLMTVVMAAILAPCFATGVLIENGNVHESSVVDGAVVAFAFDDPAHPLRDNYGYGDTMKKRENTANEITIVDDDTRGKVAYFDGTYSYLGSYCGGGLTNSFPNMPTKAEPYTVAMWVRPDKSTTETVARQVFGWGHFRDYGVYATNLVGLTANTFMRVGLTKNSTDNTKWEYFVQNVGFSSYDVGSDVLNPEKDEWHFFATVYDGKTWTTYYDDLDAPAESIPAGKNPANGSPRSFGHNFTLGASPNGPSDLYKGKMDDFILMPRALSRAELGKIKDGTWKTVVKGDRRKVAIGLRFEDKNRPIFDEYGSGEEMTLIKNGVHAAIVADADRGGSVASFPGALTTVYQATGLNKSFPGVPGKSDPFTLAMWIKPTYNSGGPIVSWGPISRVGPIRSASM